MDFNILLEKFGQGYIGAVSLFVVFIIAALIIDFVLKFVLNRIVKKTKTNLDDELVKKIRSPLFFIIILTGIYFSIQILGFKNGVFDILQKVFFTLLVLLIAKIVDSSLKLTIISWGTFMAKKTGSHLDKSFLPFFTKTIGFAVYVVATLVILPKWGVDISALLASVGIIGLALGFAVQDSLKNIFGGISLILDKSYKVGDIVTLDDGTSGVIHDMGLRSTNIKNWDNNIVVVPNGLLANMKVTNLMKDNDIIKTKIEIGVDYNSNIELVKKIILKVLKKQKTLIEDRDPVVRFDQFGDSALMFLILYWTNLDDRWPTYEKIMKELLKTFRENKINIPFPQRDMHVYNVKSVKDSTKIKLKKKPVKAAKKANKKKLKTTKTKKTLKRKKPKR